MARSCRGLCHRFMIPLGNGCFFTLILYGFVSHQYDSSGEWRFFLSHQYNSTGELWFYLPDPVGVCVKPLQDDSLWLDTVGVCVKPL